MNETRETLKNRYNIDDDQLNKLLKACGLMGRKKFDDNDRSAIEKIRSYFTDGLITEENYEAARKLYGEETGAFDQTFGELLTAAEKQDTPITLSQALEIFKICRLTEKERYSEQEVEQFLETCLAFKEGRVELKPGGNESQESNFASQAAVAIASSGQELMTKIVKQQAKVDASILPYVYIAALSSEAVSPENKRQYEAITREIEAQILGKGQQKREQIWEISVLPTDSSQAHLPPVSENG